MDWNRGNVIGRGSSATVYLATSTFSGDILAVKSAELCRSEFLQSEQRILSSLCHPCVVGYEGFCITRENGKPTFNLFMEYMAGGTIWDEIGRRGGRIKESAVGFYTRQIVSGLEYLHVQGLVHCDIKAKNILIGENCVKISDFGCSKRVDSAAAIGGTPMFMAPEAARGEEQGIPCDIWALGCTVIEMVTGGSPWPIAGDPISVLYRIGYSGDLPEIPCFLSHQAKDFLEKCLRLNPRERWTAGELLRHPFLGEFSSSSEQIKESYSNSPTSILDQGLWNSLPNLVDGSSERWDDDRIRRLSKFSGEMRLETGEENWITIRRYESDESRGNGVDSEAEADSICGSTSETSLSRYDLEEQEAEGERLKMKSLDNLNTVSHRLRKSNFVNSHLSSKRDRAHLLFDVISQF